LSGWDGAQLLPQPSPSHPYPQAQDEEARAGDAEVVEQRLLLAQALGVPLADEPLSAGRASSGDSGVTRGVRSGVLERR
jgi:hypothetical protein